MSENNYHINYSASDIEKYWKGQLSAADMHNMEKAAMDDPFLADALEGYMSRESGVGSQESMHSSDVRSSGVEADIADLRNRLQERVNAGKEKKPVIGYWWKAAAAIIVIAGGAWLYMSSQQTLNSPMAKDVANTAPDEKSKTSAIKEQLEQTPSVKLDSSALVLHDGVTDSFDSSKQVIAKMPAMHYSTVTDENQSQPVPAKPAPVALEKLMNSDSNKVAFLDRKSVPPATLSAGDLSKNLAKQRNEVTVEAKDNEQNAEKADDAKDIRRQARNFAAAAAKKEEIKGRADSVSPNAGVGTFNKVNLNLMNTFNGAVYNNLNQPVSNATIKVNGLSTGTVTDNFGNFSFKTMDSTLDVSVSSIGYNSQNITLRDNAFFDNRVVLQPDNRSLSETIVVGYGTRKKAAQKTKDLTVNVLDAEPSVGWKEYSDYLQKNKQVADNFIEVHGDVVVTFDIDSKGLMKNFKVEKSLNDTFDAEAIRLVKYGPTWKLLKGKKAKASVIVTF